VGSVLLTSKWARSEEPCCAWAVTGQVALVAREGMELAGWRARLPGLQVLEGSKLRSVQQITEQLSAAGGLEHLIWVCPIEPPCSVLDDRVINAQSEGVLELLRLIRALLALGYGQRVLQLSVISWQALSVLPGEDSQVAQPTLGSTDWWARWRRSIRNGGFEGWIFRWQRLGRERMRCWRRCCRWVRMGAGR
jgi:hypothetical protein